MKTFVIALLLICLAFQGILPAETTEQKLKTVQKELEASKQKLKKTKEEEAAVLGRLVGISKELKETKQKLSLANNKITKNRQEIGVLTKELDQAQQSLKAKESGLTGRLREIYKNSELNYFEFLLASRSVSDLLNRLYFFKKVLDHDAALIADVRADVNKVTEKRGALKNKTVEIQELAQTIAEKSVEMGAQAEEKKKIYQALQQRRQEYELQVAELEKSSEDLERLIVQKMASRHGSRVAGTGQLAWPVRGRLTSFFGYRRSPWGGRRFHTGLDIATKYGTPVEAADNGEVIFSGWWDGYGKAVVIDHGKNTTTVYGHLSRIYKEVGVTVAKGQVIGLIGSTGYSTGPHLHFEVRKSGKPTNPLNYLK